jgi:2-polyprenyl-6-hydroxyphenyl methylase / 3-demethylubiquinone-9 3-methyltransferase
MTDTTIHAAAPTLDPEEVARFSKLAEAWWDPNGKFRPLHKIGPPRIEFVRDTMISHFGLTAGGLKPLVGLSVVDIGCGGGLVSEPLTRLGASVTGIDPAEKNIRIAQGHAEGQGLSITYRPVRAEDLVAEGRTYDAVVCLEVVEHVPDVPAFLGVIGQLVRPGGVLIVSTINRTMKAYALAIVGAEYVLRWLPVGTHQWDRFVTPDELARGISAAGFGPTQFRGMTYNPLTDIWSLNSDTDVNYLASAAKPG